MKELYIVGAGGFGRETAWLTERINEAEKTWDLKGFLDDDAGLHGTVEDGYPVLGGCDYLAGQSHEVWAVCAVGCARTRRAVIEKLKGYPLVKFATLVDPSVLLSGHAVIGEGSIICAGTILTVDFFIGRHVIVNLDCTIGHDAVLEDFVTLYPSVNISGNVRVEECAELGTGMQVIQGKTIGRESIIGAGATVIRDVPEKCTAVGNPARPIKFFT